MRSLVGRPLFSVGDTEYRWEDALISAGVVKQWAALRRPTDEGLVLDRAVGIDAQLEEEIDAAADEFRHTRGLLAGDDLERWLDERGLSVDDWLGYLRRTRLRERAGEAPGRVRRQPPADVGEPLLADLICSGRLDRTARELAGRAAGAAAAGGPARRSPQASTTVPADLATVLGLSPGACALRAALVASLEAPYRRFVSGATSPHRISSAIETHRSEWTRVRLHRCRLEDVDQAKELVMLVREDRLPFPDAARRAGIPVEDARLFCEDVDPEIRDLVLGARRGEIVGPVDTGDGFVVCQMVARVEPKTHDEGVVARAKETALRAALDREIAGRITWLERSLVATRT